MEWTAPMTADRCTTVYNFASDFCKPEELREHLNCIRNLCSKKAETTVKNASALDTSIMCGFYSCGDAAEFIIMLCQRWKLPEETKYKALEIFTRFMTLLMSQLHDIMHEGKTDQSSHKNLTKRAENGHVSSDLEAGSVFSASDRDNHLGWITGENGESDMIDKEWMETIEHVKSQSKLRAVTSVMIASKVTANEHIVTLSKAADILIKQNHCYSRNVIMKSELRILNTINYNLRLLDSPYPCVMVLLEILCRIDSRFCDRRVYNTCIDLLDLYYFFRPQVLSSLSGVTISDSGLPQLACPQKTSAFITTCYNVLKVCGALLTAAVYAHDRDLSDAAITNLSEIIETSESQLARDCCLIIKVLSQEDFE